MWCPMQSRMIINVLAPAISGLRVFGNTSPLISTTGINRGLDHVKCVEVLVRRSSPVRKLASTIKNSGELIALAQPLVFSLMILFLY